LIENIFLKENNTPFIEIYSASQLVEEIAKFIQVQNQYDEKYLKNIQLHPFYPSIFQEKKEIENQCFEKIVEFFSFNNPVFKNWLQIVNQETDSTQIQLFDLKLCRLKDYFYQENVEKLNPFEKKSKIKKV
jgi:hypothetical protein